MNIETLRDVYRAELQEARSVEAQLIEALPRMIRTADAADLTDALDEHLSQTRSQLERVDAILQRHSLDVHEHRDQSMQTIIVEADQWANLITDPACRDAALIASAQRIVHYEIAVYGTLSTWARQLDLGEDAATLHAILEEEKATDHTLTLLAKTGVNPAAAA